MVNEGVKRGCAGDQVNEGVKRGSKGEGARSESREFHFSSDHNPVLSLFFLLSSIYRTHTRKLLLDLTVTLSLSLSLSMRKVVLLFSAIPFTIP